MFHKCQYKQLFALTCFLISSAFLELASASLSRLEESLPDEAPDTQFSSIPVKNTT